MSRDKKPKITIISPNTDIQILGVWILSACLKRKGHEVQLIFLPKHFRDRYQDKLLDDVVKLSRESSLIGISLMTNFFDNAVQITQKLKKDLDIPIIWGGIHPTIRPTECLDYADMVCIGEGEETLVDLVERIEDGYGFYDIPGVWFRDKEKIVRNNPRPLIQNLDSIPFPDYECSSHYVLSDGQINVLNRKLLEKHWLKHQQDKPYLTIASRGCPFGCTYCCNNTLNKMYPTHGHIRKRNVNYIIEELKSAKSSLDFITGITLADDSFLMYSLAEIKDFAEKYKRDIKLPLRVIGVTPSTIDREKLSLLVDAGMTSTGIGIQSGSERTKRLYKRHHSNQQVEKAVKIINEFKDKIKLPHYDIILDNPWEREEDLIETLLFLARLPAPYILDIFSLTFYPATDLYEKAKEEKIITDDLRDVYRKNYRLPKKTYLNRLFFLLNDYVQKGKRITPRTMRLLTDLKLRRLRLNWLLYLALKINGMSISFQRQKYLLCQALKDIQRGDWSRIARYIFG